MWPSASDGKIKNPSPSPSPLTPAPSSVPTLADHLTNDATDSADAVSVAPPSLQSLSRQRSCTELPRFADADADAEERKIGRSSGKAPATRSAAPCASCRCPSPRPSRSPRAASRRRTSAGLRPATPWTRPSPAPLADTAAAAVPPYPCHPHCPAAPPTRLRHTPLAVGRVSRDIVCRSSTMHHV
ncbi:hypothetical protein ZWY2020_013583 [Hordeum vulgare]|nr:hypothetical protein ZWY2020_013583 [Hordeum vulgare]